MSETSAHPKTEWIDVLTADGYPTGTRKPKALIHRDGNWHRAAHIWIFTNDGRVLLQRRSEAKENFPGLWDVSVAGHVSAGESAAESGVREAEEEIGLTLEADELTQIGTVRQQVVLRLGTYVDNEFLEVFITYRDITLEQLELQHEEVAGVALISIEELIARIRQRDPMLVPHRDEHHLMLAWLAR